MAGLSSPRSWWNIGRNGKSWTVLAAGDSQIAPAMIRHTLKANGPQPSILVLNGGQTDILPTASFGENNTGAQAYADLIAYCQAARANGVDRIIVCTMNAITSSLIGAQEAARLDYNDLIRSGNPVYDAIVDLAVVPGLTNPNDTSAYSDGLHYTQLGAQLAADPVRGTVLYYIDQLSS